MIWNALHITGGSSLLTIGEVGIDVVSIYILGLGLLNHYRNIIMSENNRAKAMTECKRCWKEITNNWGIRKYCSKCRIAVDKERRQKK